MQCRLFDAVSKFDLIVLDDNDGELFFMAGRLRGIAHRIHRLFGISETYRQ